MTPSRRQFFFIPSFHAPHRRVPGRQASKTPLFYRSQEHPLPPRSVGGSSSAPRPSHLRDAAAGGCEKKRFSLGRALPPAPLAPPSAADLIPSNKNRLIVPICLPAMNQFYFSPKYCRILIAGRQINLLQGL